MDHPTLASAQSLLLAIQELGFLSSSRLEGLTAALEDTSFSDVAAAIKQTLNSPKCVAIFIRDGEIPTRRLILKGSAGYIPDIGEVPYDLKQSSMTRFVFEERVQKNCSSTELSGPSKLRCGALMPGGNFINVLALPICTSSKPEESECFGVLKIENDGEDKKSPVTEKVEGAGIIIAYLLALKCERLWFANLWKQVAKAKGEDGPTYFSKLPVILSRMLRARAAFAYSLSEDHAWIHPQARSHAVSSHRLTEDSLVTSALGNPDRCLALGQEALDGLGDDPFLNELQAALSARAKNLLVAPALDDERQICTGVLVFANKEPTNFADEDKCVASELGKRIAPYLRNVKPQGDRSVSGFEKLQELFGPSCRLNGSQLRIRVREMQKERKASKGAITGDDCAKHLQISRPYFLKLAKGEESKALPPANSGILQASS